MKRHRPSRNKPKYPDVNEYRTSCPSPSNQQHGQQQGRQQRSSKKQMKPKEPHSKKSPQKESCGYQTLDYSPHKESNKKQRSANKRFTRSKNKSLKRKNKLNSQTHQTKETRAADEQSSADQYYPDQVRLNNNQQQTPAQRNRVLNHLFRSGRANFIRQHPLQHKNIVSDSSTETVTYQQSQSVDYYLKKIRDRNNRKYCEKKISSAKVCYPYSKKDAANLLNSYGGGKGKKTAFYQPAYSLNEVLSSTQRFFGYLQEQGFDFYLTLIQQIPQKNAHDFKTFQRRVHSYHTCESCVLKEGKKERWVSQWGVIEIRYKIDQLAIVFMNYPQLLKSEDIRLRSKSLVQMEKMLNEEMNYAKMLTCFPKIYRQKCPSCENWSNAHIFQSQLTGFLMDFGRKVVEQMNGFKTEDAPLPKQYAPDHRFYSCEACQNFVCPARRFRNLQNI